MADICMCGHTRTAHRLRPNDQCARCVVCEKFVAVAGRDASSDTPPSDDQCTNCGLCCVTFENGVCGRCGAPIDSGTFANVGIDPNTRNWPDRTAP